MSLSASCPDTCLELEVALLAETAAAEGEGGAFGDPYATYTRAFGDFSLSAAVPASVVAPVPSTATYARHHTHTCTYMHTSHIIHTHTMEHAHTLCENERSV